MNIIIVIGQRTCDWPGQHAPVAIACASEHEFNDDMEFLLNAFAESKESGEFDSVEMITVAVSDEAINNALFPDTKIISGSVVENGNFIECE